MIIKKSRNLARLKRHYRIRNKVSGTAERPRLCVFRSGRHMYCQIIDDKMGHTLCAASTLEKDVKDALSKTSNIEAAQKVGEAIAKKATEKGITEVVFDRGGYLFHGKVKALADSARENGLKF